jgi:CHAD domain-containing protein
MARRARILKDEFASGINPLPLSPRIQQTQKPKQSFGFAHWMMRVPEECEHAGSQLAADPVHDLRVALRRCRSMADGLMAIDPDPAWKEMKKAGKTLFQSLGELRDVQVMMEWVQKLGPAEDPETQALMALLTTREQEHKLTAGEAIRKFDVHQWRKWSRELPRRAARVKPGSLVFKHLALERWTTAHNLHRRAMRSLSQAALHQLRIGIKRFRYIVENFLPEQHQAWSSQLKNLQDLLGDVHDLDVLWDTATEVNAFGTAESRARWQAILHEAREKRVEQYREQMIGPQSPWQLWRAELPQGPQIQLAAMTRLRLWSAYLDPDVAHSRRVAVLARQLFDGLARVDLAPVSPNQDLRSTLQAAALMHGAGRSKRDKGHHKHSYGLIRRLTPPLGWSASQVQMAAAAARFHRGALPTLRHKALSDFALDQKKVVLQLAGILRFANVLDSQTDGHIQHVSIEEKDKVLTVSATGYAPWTRAAEEIAGSAYLLGLVLRRPIVLKSATGRKPRSSKTLKPIPLRKQQPRKSPQ